MKGHTTHLPEQQAVFTPQSRSRVAAVRASADVDRIYRPTDRLTLTIAEPRNGNVTMKEYFPAKSMCVLAAALSLALLASMKGVVAVICPPPGFDSVPDFDVMAYAAAPWYPQRQVRSCSASQTG